jgi:hypothetical protein
MQYNLFFILCSLTFMQSIPGVLILSNFDWIVVQRNKEYSIPQVISFTYESNIL